MKKLLVIIAISSTVLVACGSNKAEQEKKDSVAAATKADSMLKAELASDTTKKADTAKVAPLTKKK